MRKKGASIRQLEYFVTIARSANFRQAAQKLNVSQPTLTAQISALEEILGTELFERSRAGTLLTPAGREILVLARNTLEQYQQLIDYVDSSRDGYSGVFRLGICSTVSSGLFSSILPELRDMYPVMKFHIRESSPDMLEKGLEDGVFDLVLTMLPLNSVENQVRPLFIEPFDLVLPSEHPLSQKSLVQLSDLEQQEVLSIDEEYLQRHIYNVCEKSRAQLNREYEANSLESLEQMVMMGMGLAVMPSLYVRTHISSKNAGLVVFPMGTEIPGRTHVAAWRRNAPGRQLFQKLSYDIKVLALNEFSHILDEVSTEESA